MRKSLKPSQFRKEGRVRMEIAEQKQVVASEEKEKGVGGCWEKCEEGRANRWLNHLHEKPLLELMNEQIEASQFTPVKPTELNCYERLKTLLAVQNGGRCDEATAQNNAKLLKNVVIFETEINKLEQGYQSLEKNKKGGQECRNGRSYLCSKSTSKHNSVFDKNSLSYTQSTTLKEGRGSQWRYSSKHDQMKKSIKQEVSELKKQSFSRFMLHKKEVNQRTFLELEEFFSAEVERKIEELVARRVLEYDHIKEENSRFNTVLLEKELQIEQLLKEVRLKEEKLANEIEKQEPHQQMISLRLTVQQFYDEFHTVFGTVSLLDLKRKLDYMETLCLSKYAAAEGHHLEVYAKLKSDNLSLANRLRDCERKHQEREEELSSIIRQREKYDQLDNSSEKHEIFNRIPELRQKAEELERLQRFILNRYVEWLNSKSEAETSVIKLISSPSSLHNYEEMIEDMLFFNQQLSADKQTNYIGKLLTAILKLKKLIAPNKLHQKLEPLKSLEEVEVFIKNLKNRRALTKKKTFKTKTEILIENLDEMALAI